MPHTQIGSTRDVEKRFVTWAITQDDVRAAIVIGSQARVVHPADAWSDLDIVMFVTDVARYQATSDWIEALAPVWIALSGHTVAGDVERLILFAGGHQVDFVLHSAAQLPGFRQMLVEGNVPDTIRRGARVLFDKEGMDLPILKPAAMPVRTPPDQGTFDGWMRGFWFGANHAARQLGRGDLFGLHSALCGLRGQLLPLIEWHARALHGWQYDTWHNGRFIREWAEPWVISDLAATYVTLDQEACWSGLLAILSLASRVAADVARGLGLAYPAPLVAEMMACIEAMHNSGICPQSEQTQ